MLCARCYSLRHYGWGLTERVVGAALTAPWHIHPAPLLLLPFGVPRPASVSQRIADSAHVLALCPCRQVKSAAAESALPDFDFERKVGALLAVLCCFPASSQVGESVHQWQALVMGMYARLAWECMHAMCLSRLRHVSVPAGWPQDCAAKVPAVRRAVRGGRCRWVALGADVEGVWAGSNTRSVVGMAPSQSLRHPCPAVKLPTVFQACHFNLLPMQTLTARCRARRCAPSCLRMFVPPQAAATTAASGHCRWASA